MNNKTTEEIIIKHRGDGVYDIYLNDVWVSSKGHYENVLDEIRNIIKQIDA
jgi:hypothetical protein